ncbi:MAG: methylmalonyl-CoA epimerase [Fidelibacterota bacterium]
MMKILGIEHLAIVTDSPEESASFWGDLLGIAHTGTEVVESEGVTVQIYDTGKGKIELLTRYGKDSPIARFLKRKGPGLHHVCLEVDDVQSAIDLLKAKGIKLVYEKPRKGAEGYRIAFVHPSSSHGVLVELCQKT